VSVYVIDASVAAKWFIEEEFSENAFVLLGDRYHLHAPDFFVLEMYNIFSKWIRRGIASENEVLKTLDSLSNVEIVTHPFDDLLDPAFTIANRTGRDVYDCLYLVLAQALETKMITADKKFFRSLESGPYNRHILWIEDVIPDEKSYRPH